MKIAVFEGGPSREREISLISGKHVAHALRTMGHDVISIDIDGEFLNILNSFQPEIIFIALHGRFGEDGRIQGLLDILNFRYTHSGVRASAIAMHKPTTKLIFEALKIQTPRWLIFKKEELPFQKNPFQKYVLKPLSEGSSINVQIVNDYNEIDWSQVMEYGTILVEEFIPGKELSVAVLDGKALGVIEIITNKKFHDYNSKYNDASTRYILPADVEKQVYDKAMSISETLFAYLGCRGIIRVDFRYDSSLQGGLFVLEINTHPGLTPASIAPKIAEYAGIKYENLVENLLKSAKCRDD